jgi:thiamine kinase-like enzyme
MDERLLDALRRVPSLRERIPEEIAPRRIGGLTNENYKVVVDDEAYVLRIPGKGTSEYIDREVEKHNSHAASQAGVNAEVVFFDAADGLMLTRYLEGCETMSPMSFTTRGGVPARAGLVLKRMHASGQRFRFRFELFGMIEDYLRVLGEKDVDLPEGYHDVVEEAGAVREALQARTPELAPCHNDPLTENFMDNGERIWLLDWEYSGMNDPFWDLGDVSVEAGLSEKQDLQMLEAYRGVVVTPEDMGRTTIYKAMSDLLWTLWGLIQHANDNPTDDYWAYSTQRFDRCRRLMESPGFGDHLRAARTGRG